MKRRVIDEGSQAGPIGLTVGAESVEQVGELEAMAISDEPNLHPEGVGEPLGRAEPGFDMPQLDA